MIFYFSQNCQRGVQSGKTEQINTESNRNRESGLDLVVPNKPNRPQ